MPLLDFGRDFFDGRITVNQRHSGSLFGECQGNRAANAARTARHDGYVVTQFQIQIGCVLL